MEQSRDLEGARYAAVRQYSLAQILAVWAAAAVPMGVLAWIVAPWLSHHLGGREPLGEALLICFNAGLVWILVLTLILVRREQGSLEWSRMRDALWLRPPRDPKTRRVGGKVWWWVLPFALLSAGLEALPIDPTGPIARDFPNFISTDRAERFYSGAWGWFALTVMVALAPAVEHAGHPARRHLRSGLSREAVPKHLDRGRRPHASELRHDRRRPQPRAQIVWAKLARIACLERESCTAGFKPSAGVPRRPPVSGRPSTVMRCSI